MSRYAKQRDKFSCGPVAIINTMKWAGIELPYREWIRPLQSLCGCRPPEGTGHAPFDKALRGVAEHSDKDIRVRRVHNPKLREIEKHLRVGGAVILNYYWEAKGDNGRHFVLLTEVSNSGKSFLVVNSSQRPGPALRRVTRKKFKEYNLRFQRSDEHYKAWFISLKE